MVCIREARRETVVIPNANAEARSRTIAAQTTDLMAARALMNRARIEPCENTDRALRCNQINTLCSADSGADYVDANSSSEQSL